MDSVVLVRGSTSVSVSLEDMNVSTLGHSPRSFCSLASNLLCIQRLSCHALLSLFSTCVHIASIFDLNPDRPVWIVKKSGNIAVWPRGGQFLGPLLVPGAVYDVKGHLFNAESPTPVAAASATSGSSSPFGAYTSPTYCGQLAIKSQRLPLPSFLIEKEGVEQDNNHCVFEEKVWQGI